MKLREHKIVSEDTVYERTVWILENPRSSDPVCFAIFLDAEIYIHRMEARTVLNDLQQSGALPPVTCAFVSHGDGAARHHDLTCNANFARFIAEDVTSWLQTETGSPMTAAHLIAGPSLGGLAAAHITLTYPNVFARCLSQSGSFWWRNEWLTRHLNELPESKSRFWIGVGDEETQSGISHPPTGLKQNVPQKDACGSFARTLTERGHDTRFSVHAGGHEAGPWRSELPEAMAWLLNS
jgi:enterochelin esterase family protein